MLYRAPPLSSRFPFHRFYHRKPSKNEHPTRISLRPFRWFMLRLWWRWGGGRGQRGRLWRWSDAHVSYVRHSLSSQSQTDDDERVSLAYLESLPAPSPEEEGRAERTRTGGEFDNASIGMILLRLPALLGAERFPCPVYSCLARRSRGVKFLWRPVSLSAARVCGFMCHIEVRSLRLLLCVHSVAFPVELGSLRALEQPPPYACSVGGSECIWSERGVVLPLSRSSTVPAKSI
ncbi:hypothetical protein B0H16DRAFT_582209 [Mycena metata]|uniref:Uncharacterized protein n=1 Tax=Mycena metata TaxID=1033252 RepID=A0AAD7H588_9AGAR|nr:hypothetical protein B0H16DRAFT_582209 [Mycena metata]